MDAYEKNYCKEPKKKGCLDIVAIILGLAFSAVMGIIVGALEAATILGALAAVIVLAIVLGLLLVLALVLVFCNRKKDKKDKCKCYD